jgi:hypothetical protein
MLLKKDAEIAQLTDSNTENLGKDLQQALTIDDYAKNLKLIWTSDKQATI